MRFLALIARFGGLVVVLTAVLSACTVAVEEEVRPLPPGRPDFCTREYAPVCAARAGNRRTFPNACEADAAGYRIIRPGTCPAGGFDGPRVCTREYDPVCARRGGNIRTFGNACEAESAGYRIISDGQCRFGGGGGFGEPRFCTREYDPVCARRGGVVRTFGNDCEADVAGYRVIADGPC